MNILQILDSFTYILLMLCFAAMAIFFMLIKNGMTRIYMIWLFWLLFWAALIGQLKHNGIIDLPDCIRAIPLCIHLPLFAKYSWKKHKELINK